MTPHPQRCEHYPICYYVRDRKENKISECYLCIADDPYLKMVCGLDTRSHSFAPTEQDDRDKVLDEVLTTIGKIKHQEEDMWLFEAIWKRVAELRTAAKDGVIE